MVEDKASQPEGLLKKTEYQQVISFFLGEEEYALEITAIKEIIPCVKITSVPQMPEFVEGVISLRGDIIAVIDLRKRFGLPLSELKELSRIIIARLGGKRLGLIVDSVSEVVKIPLSKIQPPPETVVSLVGEYLKSVCQVGDRMLLLLDAKKIISLEEEKEISEKFRET